MSLKEQILNDIKSAMKAKDDFKRDALRQLNAAIKQVEIDTRKALSDDELVGILQKESKKRADAAELYTKGGRAELAQKELDEIELIKSYLPKQLSKDEIKQALSQIIAELGKDINLGALIKLGKEKIGAKADGKSISEAAKELLA